MSEPLFAQGYAGYLLIFVAGALMTAPWRWLGVWLSRDLDVNSSAFKWVHAVSTALVAGLVSRMVVFPSGALDAVALWVRLVALAAGVALYFVARRNLAVGVFSGALTLVLLVQLTD